MWEFNTVLTKIIPVTYNTVVQDREWTLTFRSLFLPRRKHLSSCYCAFQLHVDSKIKSSTDKCIFRCRQSSVRQVLPAYDYCWTLFVVWTLHNDLITASSAALESWEEPANIWLTVAKNAFVGWALNFRVRVLLKGAVMWYFWVFPEIQCRILYNKNYFFALPIVSSTDNTGLIIPAISGFCKCCDLCRMGKY